MTEPERPRPFFTLSGRSLLFLAVPPLALLGFGALPRFRDHRTMLLELAAAAGFLVLWLVIVAVRAAGRKEPLRVDLLVRRPHYLQMITQGGVYVYWATYWFPVVQQAPVIAAQLVFVYTVDALYAWTRRRAWVLGFAPVPVVFSTNLFLWFRDDFFAIQLVLVAFGLLSKDLIRWNRDGIRRHIFNPSSIALALASIVLLATGTTGTTFAREIATTQDGPRYIHEVLFLLGLIVQLNFPVVLVTMSAVVSVYLIGEVHHAVTGIYLFTNTSIPAAVLLGSLLLVTDPATSPTNRGGKILFGASYGAFVVASFPILEHFGHFGYFDKLLAVPFLNLLVPWFDRAGARISKAAGWGWKTNWLHVGIWVAVFTLMRLTHAVGHEHPGRSLDFWEKACVDKKSGACARLHAFCVADQPLACNSFGQMIADGRVEWTRAPAAFYLQRACDAKIPASCGRLGDVYRRGEQGAVDLVRAAHYYEVGCDGMDGLSCVNLGVMYDHGMGVTADPDKATRLFSQACRFGVKEGCSFVEGRPPTKF